MAKVYHLGYNSATRSYYFYEGTFENQHNRKDWRSEEELFAELLEHVDLKRNGELYVQGVSGNVFNLVRKLVKNSKVSVSGREIQDEESLEDKL